MRQPDSAKPKSEGMPMFVRCPECDPPPPRGKNPYYVPSDGALAKLMLGRQPRGPAWKHQAKGYTYGRDVGGGRQR